MQNKIHNNIQNEAEYTAGHRRKRKWRTLLTVLSAIVVFCTVYALILPAITLEYGDTSAVNQFRLYAWQTVDGTTTQVANGTNQSDVRSYRSGNTTYYYIPVSTLESLYSDFTFDETDTSDSPFTYATQQNGNTTTATYVQLTDTGDWYIQVQAGTIRDGRNNYTGTYLYYTYTTPVGTVETVSPSGTVINLFDYWTNTRIDTDDVSSYPTAGVNYNHALKFTASALSGANAYTNSSAVYANIVNRLLYNGYPTLVTDSIFGIDTRNTTVAGNYYSAAASGLGESLSYLFDPDDDTIDNDSNDYREAFTNVTGLLQLSDDGYYYYDCTQNFAEFDEETNSFTVYDVPRVGGDGQFFPFNSIDEVTLNTSNSAAVLNHYFGMTLTSRFVQQYGGKTSSLSNASDMIFEFSGDDDVWIYIDGVLVGDVGGIHDAASISINFATGAVVVNGTQTTTIYDQFVAAGMASSVDWEYNSTSGTYIFADGTYHKLKFFYLERGSYSSNLLLKYNLNEYPDNGITKTDQYGDPVAGATFAVYASNSNYEILSDLNGTVVNLDNYDYYYDDDGNIVDSATGTILVNALYVGTTDSNGKLSFVDEDSLPYPLSELEEMFGEYFILREIGVPEGYRSVSDDTYLQFYNDTVIICNNTYESGVYAAPNELITAPNYLTLYNGNSQFYYDESSTEGILFAVVMKYVGDDVGDSNSTTQALQSNWAAVYGDYTDGFSLVSIDEDSSEAYIQAAIDAANQYSSTPVFSLTAGGQMQLYLTDLPGDIRYYYAELGDNEKNLTEYTVSYFWSSASSWDDVSTSNTYSVNSYDTTNVFTRSFGSTIRVPDLINRVQVQKLDPDGNAVNGATFAIYEVAEVAGDDTSGNSSTVYYVASDGTYIYLYDENGDNTGKAVVQGGAAIGSYEIGEDGVISVTIGHTSYTINPVDVQETGYGQLTGEYGMATFTNLANGYYYVREVAVPTGYALNTTEVMTLVNDETVTANAGTVDDGVEVARGTGYLVYTLDEFAAEGVIDNTLSWIYANLRVSGLSTSFADADISDYSSWGYTSQNYYDGTSALTTDTTLAYASYLMYDADHAEALYNYITNTAYNSATTRRIFTEIGWSHLEIYQDTVYGLSQTAGTSVNYTNLAGIELTNLFSRSVYIRVTDQPDPGNLEISKTVNNYTTNTTPSTQSFEFTVTLTDSSGAVLTDTFDYTIYDVDDSGVRTESSTGTITSGGTITLTDSQVAVIENLPFGTLYTVTETENLDYSTTYVRDDGLDPVAGYESSTGEYTGTGTTASGTLYWWLDTTNDVLYNTSTVDFTNTYYGSLALYKVDAKDGTTGLEGAEFTITKTVSGETYYYTGSGWTTTETTVTTDADGYIGLAGSTFFAGTADSNTYTITEVTPPNGYEYLASPITMVVDASTNTISSALFSSTGTAYDAASGGNVITVATDNLSLTVTNQSGYELPESGGGGNMRYLIAGITLMAAAAALLLRKKLAK